MSKLNLKFYSSDDFSFLNVKAKRKDAGKWEIIGTCHPASKHYILDGRLDLIQTNLEKPRLTLKLLPSHNNQDLETK